MYRRYIEQFPNSYCNSILTECATSEIMFLLFDLQTKLRYYFFLSFNHTKILRNPHVYKQQPIKRVFRISRQFISQFVTRTLAIMKEKESTKKRVEEKEKDGEALR